MRLILAETLLGLCLIGTSALAEDLSALPENAPADFKPTEQVLVEGGGFTMGNAEAGEGYESHAVVLRSFYIEKHEVTNAQWQAFCEAKDRKLPVFWGLERFRCGEQWPDHPVVGVNHGQARAYAAWIGSRLPTEAEWEYAARGGLAEQRFHTGDELPDDQANTKAAKIGATSPVGSFAPNAFGLYDLVGNVREWTWDFYSDSYFAECAADGKSDAVTNNPTGPEKAKWRVIKGGGWFSGKSCNAVHVRNALPPSWSDFNVGFRCARDVPIKEE